MVTPGDESARRRRARCGEAVDGATSRQRWPACRGMALTERHGSSPAECRISWSTRSGLPAEGWRTWSGGRLPGSAEGFRSSTSRSIYVKSSKSTSKLVESGFTICTPLVDTCGRRCRHGAHCFHVHGRSRSRSPVLLAMHGGGQQALRHGGVPLHAMLGRGQQARRHGHRHRRRRLLSTRPPWRP